MEKIDFEGNYEASPNNFENYNREESEKIFL